MGRGDQLASGQKKATFFPPVNKIEARNVAEPTAEDLDRTVDEMPSIVDNSALFVKPEPIPIDFEPIHDMVLVRLIEVQAESSIILPDISKGKANRGIVHAVGEGARDKNSGALIPPAVKVGDLVMYDRYAAVGQEIKLADDNGNYVEYLMLREYDIMGKLHERKKVEPCQ